MSVEDKVREVEKKGLVVVRIIADTASGACQEKPQRGTVDYWKAIGNY